MAKDESAELRNAFAAYLEERNISSAEAKALHWEPFLAAEAAKKFGLPPGVTENGFVIPYFDRRGRVNCSLRWRNLTRAHKGGFADTTEWKPEKYLQPPKTEPSLYYPPWKTVDWDRIAKDIGLALVITEGEIKAYIATKAGLPTLGLGGVWNFRSAARGWRLLPELKDRWTWKGERARPVYILVDSDARELGHQNVQQAANALATELLILGAEVYVGIVPSLFGERKKTGWDDYILIKGADGGNEFLQGIAVWSPSVALAAYNRKFAMNEELAAYWSAEHRRHFRPEEFLTVTRHDFHDELKVVSAKKGEPVTKLVSVNTGAAWRDWAGQAIVKRSRFLPIEAPNIITDRGELNLYSGLRTEPKRGDIAPWTALLDHLFTPVSADERRWFEQFAAYPIQQLLIGEDPKMQCCAVLRSTTHGTGKGLAANSLVRLYGRHGKTISNADLKDAFNDWQRELLFCFADEISAETKEKERYEAYLRRLISEPSLSIREMYMSRYYVDNYINWLFATNSDTAFALALTDRRYFIARTREEPILAAWGQERIDAYLRWIRTPEAAAALLYHFAHIKLAGFDHRSPLENAEKLITIEDSASKPVLWLLRAAQNPAHYLRGPRVWNKEKKQWVEGHGDRYKLWRAEDLLKLYRIQEHDSDHTPKSFGRALSSVPGAWVRVHHGWVIRDLRHGSPTGRLWTLATNRDEMFGKRESSLAALYNAERDKNENEIENDNNILGPPD